MDRARHSSRKALSRRHVLGLALGGTLLLSASPFFTANAAPAVDPFVLKCQGVTPTVSTSNYPGMNRIILSNNLARPTGKAIDAPGQLLHISGRITDENCVPIANAMVDLWQTNPFGTYRWATRDELLNPEPVFAGNGRAVTDNMGRFNFTTLFPAAYARYAPHINFRVTHPDFPTLNTAMYFRDDHRNEKDSRLNAFRGEQRERLMAEVSERHPAYPERGLQSSFNIVMKGKHTFRRY